MTIGYKFRILNANGSVSSTTVDMDDMFVPRDAFLNSGLYSWGDNAGGALGQNTATTADQSSPVQVGSLTNWKQVSTGGTSSGYTAAIKTDGTLWSWGDNLNGKLGLNDSTDRSSPIQVGSLTDWKQVSCGPEHTVAIKTDYTLWSWGNNASGELGQNTGGTADRSSPVQVGTLRDWKQVSAGGEAAGGNVAAIKTDGTLWTWGDSTSGKLGLGSTLVNISSPTQVGTLTDWKQVASGTGHCAAIKTNGSLWTWGLNTNGRLGLNDTTSRSSPTQVGTLTDWKQVASGTGHCIAIKVDGTLWAWGLNTNGRLGLNDIVHRSSPTQVGSLTNWKQVAGADNTTAIKTDGTLWVWGINTSGQLGLSDLVHRSSPTQVGSLTNWKQIDSSSQNHTLAIVSDDFYTYNNP